MITPFNPESFLLKMSPIGGLKMLEKEINLKAELQSFNTSLCITMNILIITLQGRDALNDIESFEKMRVKMANN